LHVFFFPSSFQAYCLLSLLVTELCPRTESILVWNN
jgi:hypothetical protein